MLILLAIFLFLFIPLVMLILHVIWPRMNIQGFLALLVALAGWILVFIARPVLARSIPLLEWQPASLFYFSPALLIDSTAWYFALAIVSLGMSVVIGSIALLGKSPSTPPKTSQSADAGGGEIVQRDKSDHFIKALVDQGERPSSTWLLWISILTLTGLGLLAVTSGNLVTLFLAWSALDILELLILLDQVRESKTRERIILVFSAQMMGLCLALVAGILLWSRGSPLEFDAISPPIGSLLVLAAGLRLGVLPFHLPFSRSLPIDRNLEMALHLIPSAASFVLLVRVASGGVAGNIAPILVSFSILAGLFAAIVWLRAKDEIEGQPYWLIGTSSLAVVAAILHQPFACLAWSVASLLSGGLVFSLSLRHKNILPIIVMGLFNLSAIPFSPTWQGAGLYQFSSSLGVSLTIFAIFSLFFLLIQAFLFAGYIRLCLLGIYPTRRQASERIERWIWFLYPLGLVVLVISHFLIGWRIYPNLPQVTFSEWVIGPISLLIAGLALYFVWRTPTLLQTIGDRDLRTTWGRLFSLEWVYGFLWKLFRTLLRIFSLVSRILEGEGGLLWAIALFGLIFVFMQK